MRRRLRSLDVAADGCPMPTPALSRALSCPLCGADAPFFHRDKRREYFRCLRCELIFVPPDAHPLPAQEKAEYDLHDNRPDDPGYRRFLSRVFEPVRAELKPGARGLDFGSGPGPTLSVMFEEAGFPTTIYDPFYAPDRSVLDCAYDFVTATEVVEHLHHPARDLERLWSCVAPGGVLGLMTKMALDLDAFRVWHYKNDLTHVVFFSRHTFKWLGEGWQAPPSFHAADVVLFRKAPF